MSVYLDKVKKHKPTRSIGPQIIGTLDPNGDRLILSTYENSDAAYITISGNGEYLTEMVNFMNGAASIDVSVLGAGVYTITVEFENGAKYTGHFEFIE